MLGIVRYVRHLDMTVHAIHIKTKLCQLVEVMMKRRDDLAFRQEIVSIFLIFLVFFCQFFLFNQNFNISI